MSTAVITSAVATTTGVEIHEVVRTLGVESGVESNTWDGTGLHGVVREGFNCKMDVITKIETKMGKVSWRAAGDSCGGADGGRNVVKSGDIVEHGVRNFSRSSDH